MQVNPTRSPVAPTFEKAFGFQGNAMNLPVGDVEASIPYYERVFGFRVQSREATPVVAATLGRDAVQIRLVQNGGDPTQDGCAFHVRGVHALHGVMATLGLGTGLGALGEERRNGEKWTRFFVVAPDGLCFWVGERA